MSNKDFWIEVLTKLQPMIKKAHFITWFQNTTVMDFSNGLLVVGVPNTFAQTWISTKYGLKIEEIARELDKTVETIKYEVCGKLLEKDSVEAVNVKKVFEETDQKKVRKSRGIDEVVVSRGQNNEKVSSQILNKRYTLDNFVTGKDNRLPHAAALAVSNMPGGIYNPLYVYGSVGLGKSHLLHAIGNEVVKNFPDLTIKYITAERFVTEVVEAIGKRNMNKFKDQYRNVDVFLIDDVQFFARKDSSQQEFFHTFNYLYDANKQIVLTSDRPPSELDGLDERLKSRFGMGMVVELLSPDFETRLAILQQKCQEYQTLIDNEVLTFIANNVLDSVRGLEGVLKQAIAESQLADRVPTIRSVAEIIRRLNKAQEIVGYDVDNKKQEINAKTGLDVMNLVARYYNVTVEDLIGKNRHKEIMIPRQVCMYLIKNELGESYEKIGSGFGGRNHTTVMHACTEMSKRLRKNVKLVKDLNTIKKEMGL